MTTDRIRHEIKLRWNKINSNHKKDFPDAYLDDIINDSINDYIEMFYSGNNSKKFKLGFEVTQQRIDMLSTLVVPFKNVATTLVSPTIYKVELANLSPKYKHFVRARVLAPECSFRLPIDIIRHNDIDTKLEDTNTQPSLRWRRVLGTIKAGSSGPALYIHTASNFTAPNIEIEYIKRPVKFFSSGYDSLEYLEGDTTAYKSTDPAVTTDLPEDYHPILVDIVVQNIARILEDNNKFTLTEEKTFRTT